MQENKGRMSWKAFWLLMINPLTAAVYFVFFAAFIPIVPVWRTACVKGTLYFRGKQEIPL